MTDETEEFTFFTGKHAMSMELRDYFAATALQGMLSYDARYKDCTDLAQVCYKIADAMLKVKNGEQS